ncbi:hypothetical protein AB9K34_02350 [Sedimentitalea sp. XS_ASV28]|uniref:hypothetical protein n=1 Tax=Sedimentitalea sp. XS_ASV28 TaxID=3241296 RepID=UPI003517ED2D
MLVLYTYPAGSGQFSLSQFRVKAAAPLKMSGRDWSRRDFDDLRKMPLAKLPVPSTQERLIPDRSSDDVTAPRRHRCAKVGLR